MFDVAAISMLAFGAAGTFAPSIEIFNFIRFAQAMSTAGLQTLSAALCKFYHFGHGNIYINMNIC